MANFTRNNQGGIYFPLFLKINYPKWYIIKIKYYICIYLNEKEMTTYIRNKKENTIKFFRNGIQVFDFTISGNIVEFSTGEFILI